MSRHRRPRLGDGTAWLVADVKRGDYVCFWYTGPDDGDLAAHARMANPADAVAWGRDRTTRVRIRTAEGRTYWAGRAPKPEGFAHTWSGTTETAPVLGAVTGGSSC